MAVAAAEVSVTTSATLLSSSSDDSASGHTLVFTPPSAIYVGPAGVTTSGGTKGYLLTAGVEYAFDLGPGDALYGVAASGTVVVPTLRVGV